MLEGADAAGMNRSLPLQKALDDCILAFAMNGEALRLEQGYPLRAVIPGWEGNLWVNGSGESRSATSRGRPARKPRNTPIYHCRRPLAQTHLRHGCEVGGDQSIRRSALENTRPQRVERPCLVGPRHHHVST